MVEQATHDAAPAAVVPAGDAFLSADLSIPVSARGVVVFAHGSGSGRSSPRNRFVASALREGRLATLLLDLLTPEEERLELATGRLRFDIGFLAGRLLAAVDWVRTRPETAELDLGIFGASTGAAAALVVAAERPGIVAAVVSRGGRPDLAGPALPQVRCPTLLIVGGEDHAVLRLNREAFASLDVEKDLLVVPGATHLFEEAGALEEVAGSAREWFVRYLKGGSARGSSGRPFSSPGMVP